MRRIVRNILRQLGFQNIVEADDGSTAWETLNKDQIDFIVSDWNMPNMSGIELLRKVRASEEFADLPFLMVTAEAQQENIIEAVQAKVSNYIRITSYNVCYTKLLRAAGEHHRGRAGQGLQLHRQAVHG